MSAPKIHRPHLFQVNPLRTNIMRLLTIMLLSALTLSVTSDAFAQSPASQIKKDSSQNTVSALDVSTQDGKTILRIKGNHTPAFSVFKLGNPLRLFVDISNSQLADSAIQKQIHDGLITQVGLLQFENEAQAVTRAIIGFNQEAVTQYDVTTEGNDVVIVVSGRHNPTAAIAKNDAKPSPTDAAKDTRIASLQKELDSTNAERQAELKKLESLQQLTAQQQARVKELESKLAQTNQTQPTSAIATASVEPKNTVRGLDIVSVNGKDQIIIDLDRPGAFKTTSTEAGRAVMILNNVELPKNLQRTLAADTRGGTVRFVKAIAGQNNQTRLEAKLDKQSSEVVRQSGKRLIWEFAPSMYQQLRNQAPATQLADNHRVMRQQTRPNIGDTYTAAPPDRNLVVTNPTQITSIPGMKNKRITIDLRDVDIQNVLRLIAAEGGINIVTSDGVTGKITLKLSGVPLDEVFLTIMQAQGLGFEKRGNVFRVAPQAALIKEQKERAEAQKASADVRPLELFLLPVRYASADDLSAQIKPLISKRGSLSVDKRTNTLIIKDTSDNLNAIKQLVDSLDSQVPQVLIEARIVETSDSFSRAFGIQWGGDASFSQANGNPTGLLFPSVFGVTGGTGGGASQGTSSTPNFAVNLPAAAGQGSGGAIGFTLGSVGGAVNLNLRLSALESTGHAKIVSAPQIMTMDNQSASISQGRSIPISVVSANGAQTSFVNATLDLTVTPSVTPDGNIRLKINATKNEPDFQNTGAKGDPSIVTRSAKTELMIRDGDTTVIGGIYTSNTGTKSAGVPFLKDIPILGYFFRTTSTSNQRSELLIFITPKIVNRAESIGQLDGQRQASGEQAI